MDASRGNALAKVHGVPAYRSATEAYRTEQIDAASVCLPSALHADAVVEALEAGADVIVEKPIDVTLAAADRIVAESERSNSLSHQPAALPAGGIVHPFVHRRGAPGTRDLRCSVESAFFRPQAYYESGDWRGTAAIDGGGALMNQGVPMLWTFCSGCWGTRSP